MSSLEEPGGEVTSLPVSAEFARDEGKRFTDFNEKFRQLIEAANLSPSSRAIVAVDAHKDAVSKSAAQMEAELFFRATGEENLIRAAVSVVLHETEQNWHLAEKIDPDEPAPESFPEGLRDMLVAKLMEEDEDVEPLPNWIEVDIYDPENLEELPADALAHLVCSTHRLSVEDLYGSLMDSDEIIDHTLEEAEWERKRTIWLTAGAATLGAFLGTVSGRVFSERRKK